MASERVFNFTSIFKSFEVYEDTKNELKEMILMDYSSRRKKAKIQLGNNIIDSTNGRVLINLLIMKPFVNKGITLTENDLFSYDSVTEGTLNDYFNKMVHRGKNKVEFDELRVLIAETINEMSDISGRLNILAGNSISFYDFVRLSVEDEEAKELFNQKIDKKLQFNEIEEVFNKLGDKLEDFFKKNKNTELHPFVISETGINKKQLTQAIGFVGLKPDIDGSVIPVAIEDNYLTGLKSLDSYYINSKGTRKALITNSKMVRRSGYLTRKLSLSMIDRFHDHEFEDCKTKHFVIFEVDNEKKLKQISGRHYYEIDDEAKVTSELKTIKKDDKKLVGKKIGLRSPVTCAGKHVCKTCYGSELSEINKDLNTGLVSVLLLTNPLTQKLLSAKHLLTTKTDRVNWDPKFLEYFTVNMNNIYIADPDISISFNKIPKNEWDEDEESPYTDSIEVYHSGKKVAEFSKLPVRFYYNDTTSYYEDEDGNNEDTGIVTLNAIDYVDEPIFTYLAKNNELTKSLQEILDLIESSGHLKETDYHGMVNRFNTLLLSNGLHVISVHAEMIISVLIRDAETGKRLDFSKKDLNEYKIVRVSKSVMNAPLSVSLAFERIDEQLVDLQTYEKDEESLMDHLYK
jgi:hypothetical protein